MKIFYLCLLFLFLGALGVMIFLGPEASCVLHYGANTPKWERCMANIK